MYWNICELLESHFYIYKANYHHKYEETNEKPSNGAPIAQ